jgi:hypothetical protein
MNINIEELKAELAALKAQDAVLWDASNRTNAAMRSTPEGVAHTAAINAWHQNKKMMDAASVILRHFTTVSEDSK